MNARRLESRPSICHTIAPRESACADPDYGRRFAVGGAKRRQFLHAGALTIVTIFCGWRPRPDDMHHFLRSHETLVSGVEYRVAPPDVLQISSAQAGEIDGEIQAIRTD